MHIYVLMSILVDSTLLCFKFVLFSDVQYDKIALH